MLTVNDLLKSGLGSVVETVPTDSVQHALQLMVENNTGLVAVTDQDRTVGIFTETDFFQNTLLKGRASPDTPIREIMTKHIISVRPEQSLDECLELMNRYQIHHLLVQDGDRLIGHMTKNDVMQQIISSNQDLIKRLENYIVSADYGR